jgi:2-polyprenyl-3-methyl-5-hydroxy-6-metoxy-1,4-benzoquinol methylase
MMPTFDEEWRERFERFGRTHEVDHLVSGWSERGLWTRVKKFAEFLEKRFSNRRLEVLDVGCGAGTYVRYLAQAGHRVVGLDYSSPSLRRAFARDTEKKGRYVCGEIYHLPFERAHFDLVVSIGVIQAIGHPDRAMDELARVVKPGGYLVLEALNALELIALWRRSQQLVTRHPPRLQTYTPSQVQGWLRSRGFFLLNQVGIYLPPRWCSSRDATNSEWTWISPFTRVPGLSLLLAHSFLFFSIKET